MARAFNWLPLLEEQRIPSIERGPNVKRGERNIRCPMCGASDPSFHMGLNLETGYWACWRNDKHRGKSPLRLVMVLLNVPYWKAREIAGLTAGYIDPEGFSAVAARILGHDGLMAAERLPEKRYLDFAPDFGFIEPTGGGYRHFRYLVQERGFGASTSKLVRHYDLAFGHGVWSDRVIFPYFIDGELVTWSGRTINKHPIRYKDLPLSESLVPPKQTLYNHDVVLTGGLALLVVEGPVDALKLDIIGRDVGIRAVALSTNSMTEDQMYIITEAAPSFRRVLFMLDNASVLGIVDSMRMRAKVSHIPNSEIVPVPFGAKDAGELKLAQVMSWASQLEEDLL